LNWAPDANGNSSWANPLAYLQSKYQTKTNNLISNAILSYHLLQGFEVLSNFGYTNLQSNEVQTYPHSAFAPEYQTIITPYAFYANNDINSWLVEPQLKYRGTVGLGKLEVLIGATFNQQNSNGQQLKGTGYSSDQLMEDIKSAATVVVQSTTAAVYRYNAIFGRLNYNWEEKYLVTLSARRDGSSRFGSATQFHNFWSIGGAWVFSNEDIIKRTLPFLSFGKLRGSYGTTGNDQIGDYQFLSTYSPVSVPVPYQNVGALQPNGLTNPYLEWEETRKLEGGIDLGFAKDRLELTVNYAHNRSSNQLLSYPLSIITGFAAIDKNLPATVQNTSWEFALHTANIRTKDFSWDTRVTLTIPYNKLLSFPGLDSSSYAYYYVIGQPITIAKLFHSLGVDPATGLYRFAGQHGPTSNPDYSTDLTSFVDVAPKYYGGFQNTFKYKGFQFDFLFQFVKKNGFNSSLGVLPGWFFSMGAYNSGNQLASLLNNRWQKPGDQARIQKFSTIPYGDIATAFYDARSSDEQYSDVSFIRLKNCALSWDWPLDRKHLGGVKALRIFLQGQNLLTFTKYKGYDPETLNVDGLPPLKVYTVGVQIGL
jgi:hypothetical protein